MRSKATEQQAMTSTQEEWLSLWQILKSALSAAEVTHAGVAVPMFRGQDMMTPKVNSWEVFAQIRYSFLFQKKITVK